MDDHQQLSWPERSSPAHASEIELIAGDPGVVISLQRLRSAVAEIFTALNETLRNDRSKASECLLRAEALLETVEQQALPAPAIASQGLAPWQVRLVVRHIDSNLDSAIRNKDLAALARLSESHFNVAFRKSVGHSPHGYI